MRISYLLNPFCGEKPSRGSPEAPPTRASSLTTTTLTATGGGLARRQKVPKDAPIFTEGNRTVGHVNFPPFEPGRQDQHLRDQHRRFQVYPSGEISRKGVRHIPYNSDKRDFLDKTGREAFEMFQYTYKRPGDDKEYVVVWDYNTGLVRMTPFFKSCKYSKTIPAKALRENPGLKDISYSITGGALVCQGYWFPYEAGRLLAATFCFDIRWALTPVFGNDFPSICLHPTHPRFAKFLVEPPSCVEYCARETARMRDEGAAYVVARLPPEQFRQHRMQQPRALSYSAREPEPPPPPPPLPERRAQPVDIESGYGTDTDRSDQYFCSPQVSPRSQFTPINRPLSPRLPLLHDGFNAASLAGARSHAALHAVTATTAAATSAPVACSEPAVRTKRTHSKVAFSDDSDDDHADRPRTANTADSCYSGSGSGRGSGRTSGGSGKENGHARVDLDAAQVLLSLCTTDHAQPPTKRTRLENSY